MATSSGPERGGVVREEILDRIRTALADGPPTVPIPRDYDRSLLPGANVGDLFAERVSDYRAAVHRASPDGLSALISSVLGDRGIRRLVVPAGIPEPWLAASAIERMGDDPALSVDDLDGSDGVITGCAVAIAETGTIVLDAGAGQGRRALSLLPDYHLCIVALEQVVGTVAEALERLDPRRPLTWISGPSATSDIELERVEGVHGPRVLDVVLVDPSAPLTGR